MCYTPFVVLIELSIVARTVYWIKILQDFPVGSFGRRNWITVPFRGNQLPVVFNESIVEGDADQWKGALNDCKSFSTLVDWSTTFATV